MNPEKRSMEVLNGGQTPLKLDEKQGTDQSFPFRETHDISCIN